MGAAGATPATYRGGSTHPPLCPGGQTWEPHTFSGGLCPPPSPQRPFPHLWLFSLSHVQLFVTPWTAAHQASLSFTISQSVPKLTFIESVMPSNHLVLCRPLLLLPSIFPSIRIFSNRPALHIRWPRDWSFSFNISPSNEYSGLISFRMDWFDLLESPRDSQESPPTPQLKSINPSVLSLLYGPTLTSIHDYWKNYSFDCTDLCWQSDVSAFEYTVNVCHSFSSKKQESFHSQF